MKIQWQKEKYLSDLPGVILSSTVGEKHDPQKNKKIVNGTYYASTSIVLSFGRSMEQYSLLTENTRYNHREIKQTFDNLRAVTNCSVTGLIHGTETVQQFVVRLQRQVHSNVTPQTQHVSRL